jgi:hypothetical protein
MAKIARIPPTTSVHIGERMPEGVKGTARSGYSLIPNSLQKSLRFFLYRP